MVTHARPASAVLLGQSLLLVLLEYVINGLIEPNCVRLLVTLRENHSESTTHFVSHFQLYYSHSNNNKVHMISTPMKTGSLLNKQLFSYSNLSKNGFHRCAFPEKSQ